MSYICLECGNIFDEGEELHWQERHGFADAPYEKMSGCPVCCGAYIEAAICNRCRGAFHPDKLYAGCYCEDCLRKSIDYNLAYDYFMDRDYLMQFIFEKYYGSSIPDQISDKLKADVQERYLRMKIDDTIRKTANFLNLIIEFIMDDDGDVGRENYADWLRQRKRNGKL